ncbi:glucosamine-6-phosphate isomerases/6-phosphogluconolactonase-domain-containing protein [Pelagophyceae sp. CCMP2097]|nr:glucosamine-6-phosphate isomerases/6-phosphogluconolactonase-domain-containing protein [Pelagophyceae sp. CCMP2097]
MMLLFQLLLVAPCAALRVTSRRAPRRDSRGSTSDAGDAGDAALAPARAGCVTVLPDAVAVGEEVWRRVDAAAERAIAARGRFFLAIPGGSVLKMLAGTAPAWASSCVVAYVNHKAVPNDDAALATHAKAWKGFLGDWTGVEVLTLEGTADCVAEACRYGELLELATQSGMATIEQDDGERLPVFDMMLVGVGDDGHIGSLYPDRDEVLDDYAWVLPVEMKVPGSVTLAFPVIHSAREVVVAACGVSDKYPQGKSEAMRRAVQAPETLRSFPAAGLRDVADYVFDVAAASQLDAAFLAD